MGELEQGRSDIEAAVALGSNDALLRAYLGKAYFEEKRSPLDSQQFSIASELDPMDPTPWLYEGIAKQTQNRPVEAAAALRKSIELNDNRATYRGRLLLDKDRAARGTSLARVYNDLNFPQLGVNESSNSLTLDPANASAHRFLSDTYRNVRRREIARVSELLQAQMMQDNNVNPVQPSVSSTNLNIVTAGGPANAGFNEFTPLFERDEIQFNVSGFIGENDNDDGETDGGEAVVSGVFDRYSFSLGAFDFNTDGYRENNDLDHEIQNLYGQVALTPELNLQAEFSHRESENGDLTMNFDLDDFDPSFNREFEEDTGRIGLRYTPSSRSDFLVSYIHADRENDTIGSIGEQVVTIPVIPPPPLPPIPTLVDVTIGTATERMTDETSDQFEGQYLFNGKSYNIVAGASFADVEQDISKIDELTFTPPNIIGPPGGMVRNVQTVEPDIEGRRVYIYSYLSMPQQVTWTLGMSHHDYDQDDEIDFDKYNPKLGLQWNLDDSVQLRAAWFKSVKPALASNRTLEPTQVAGFNQYFDDTNATKSERIGVGLDWTVQKNFLVGTEFTRRELETPKFQFISTTERDTLFLDGDEWSHRAYAYWMPANRWSTSLEAVYDKYEGDELATDSNFPLEVTTITYPLSVQHFHPSGFFAGVSVTYVDQEVKRSTSATFSDGDSEFTVTDLTLGYRFPRRMGNASLSVQNLTDRDFEYQDDSYREFQDEPSIGPYYPERTVMARITLNF
jgi:tetratricopeptide (TPR) repeat protein